MDRAGCSEYREGEGKERPNGNVEFYTKCGREKEVSRTGRESPKTFQNSTDVPKFRTKSDTIGSFCAVTSFGMKSFGSTREKIHSRNCDK